MTMCSCFSACDRGYHDNFAASFTFSLNRHLLSTCHGNENLEISTQTTLTWIACEPCPIILQQTGRNETYKALNWGPYMHVQTNEFTPTRGPRPTTRGSPASHESGGQSGHLWKATFLLSMDQNLVEYKGPVFTGG